MALRDLQSKKLIVAKGLMFAFLGIVSAVLVVMEGGTWWRRLVLLSVCIWAFCRAYYFAFYVLEHYVDSNYNYSGLMSAIRYLSHRPGREKPSKIERTDSDTGRSR